MRYGILGPVELWHDGRPVHLAPKQRFVLAALLLGANRVVPTDRLIDLLWKRPPTTATNTLHSVVLRLRRALPDGALVTRAPGYLLKVAPEELDLAHFHRLVAEAAAAAAAGEHGHAVRCWRDALGLWRGPALADVDAEILRQVEAPRLEEQRLAALEACIWSELRLGRHAQLIGELTGLVAAYPLRERFSAQLMLALYRSGRQAEALAVYRETRRVLVEELGTEPGAELQRLERAVLTRDPGWDWWEDVGAGTPSQAPELPAPVQLPPDVAVLAGRHREVALLAGLLEPGPEGSGLATVTALITGPPGVGKTALAVYVAHRVRTAYPDGCLYVGLRGAPGQAADASEVLAGFLRALGVDGSLIPHRLEERAGLYRSMLASRQVLVVLDDALDEQQVRPLLSASPTCAVLITSRWPLAALEVSSRIQLTVLTSEEAVRLLTGVAGGGRVAAEPQAARQIANLCGQLPLALHIAGAKLAVKPHWRLTDLAERLIDERRRLDELAVGDIDVRASFNLSYQSLDAEARRLFRLLGLPLGRDFAAWLAAALLQVDMGTAERRLDRLVEAHLVEVVGRDAAEQTRYRFHDLIAVFARERAEQEEDAACRRGALQASLDAAVALARHAGALLEPGDAHGDGSSSSEGRHGGVAPAARMIEKNARGWLSAERAGLVAAVEQAHAGGLWRATWELTLALSAFFEVRSHWEDWQHTHELALDATRRAGCCSAEAWVLVRLGELHADRSRWSEAHTCFSRCLPMFRDLGDRRGELTTLRSMGHVHREQCAWAQALDCFERGLSIARELGNRREEAEILRGLGIIHRQQGRLDEALACLERCLLLAGQLSDRRWEAIVRRSLSLMYRDQGRLQDAAACLERCLVELRQLGDRLWEAYTLNSLGLVRQDQVRLDEARRCLVQSRMMFAELHDRSGEGYALEALGGILHDLGRLEEAQDCLEQCRDRFAELDDRLGLTRTLYRLGLVYRDQGCFDPARRCLQRSLEIANTLGLVSYQQRAASDLATLPGPTTLRAGRTKPTADPPAADSGSARRARRPE